MKTTSLSPIIIFSYRRMICKTIDSLLLNKIAENSLLFIFSDGSKNDTDYLDIKKLREYLKTIKGFKNIHIFESLVNRGLATSIISGVTEVIKEYGKAIVVEDDLIVSIDFLEYMNEALNYYEYDNTIWSISGYSPKLPFLENYKKDIFLSPRSSSWGWGTWYNRWSKIDWEIKDWLDFKKNKKQKKFFNNSGNDMFKMLELQMLGKIDSWAIRWCYNQYKHNAFAVYPRKSKIINDGFTDGKGTHNSGFSKKWVVDLDNNKVHFENILLDNTLITRLRHFHNLRLSTRFGYFFRKYGAYLLIKTIYNYIITNILYRNSD